MKRVILIFLSVACWLPLWSQADRLDSLLEDVLSNETEISRFLIPTPKFQFLYAGTNFDNKTFYAGREIGDQVHNMSAQVFYLNSNGLFMGVSGSWYSQLEPSYKNTVLSAGYGKTFNKVKSLSARVSYSRYLYYKPDPEYDYAYNNNLGTGLTFRKKWFGARMNFNFLFGQDVGMNMSANLFSKIKLIKLNKFDNIQIEPEILFFVASEATETDNTSYISGRSSDSSLGTISNTYGILNTQFYLPLSISFGNFDLELGYSVNIPSTREQNISYPVSSFFSVSLGYMISLK